MSLSPMALVTADLQVNSPALGDSPVVLLGLRAQPKL